MTREVAREWPVVIPAEAFSGGRITLRFPRPERWCPACSGQGADASGPCRHCCATGLIAEPKEIDVVLPAGLTEGARVPVPGHGIALPDAPRIGDLFLVPYADPRDGTRIVGLNVHTRVDLSPLEARTGVRRTLATPAGRVAVEIAPRIADGAVLEVRGAGLPSGAGEAGSLFVEVRVPEPAVVQRPAREVETAKRALQGGRYREAELHLRPLTEADPNDGEAHYLLGRTLLARGEPKAAIGPLRRALVDGHFATAELYVTTGVAYLRAELPGLAIWQASLALRERPLFPSGAKLLVEAVPRFLVALPTSRGWSAVAAAGEAGLPDAQKRYFQSAARPFEDLARTAEDPRPALFFAGTLRTIHGLVTGDYGVAADGLHTLLDLRTRGFELPGFLEHLGALVDAFLTQAPPQARVRLTDLAASDGRFADARAAALGTLEAVCARDASADPAFIRSYTETADRLRARAAETGSADAAVAAGAVRWLVDRVYRGSVEHPDESRFHVLSDAIRDVWLGVHLAPDDTDAVALLADLQDELSGVIARLLARGGRARNAFFQNTFDALVGGALPFAALAPEEALKLGARGLMEHYWWAYDTLYAGIEPAQGEFLVDAVPDRYVLTSYRLLQVNPDLGDYDLIPLPNVRDYDARKGLRGATRVTVHLRDGGVVDYGWMGDGLCPNASVVRRLLHEARWTNLPASELAALRSGYGGEVHRPPTPEEPLLVLTPDPVLEATPLEDGGYVLTALPEAPPIRSSAPPSAVADAFCPGCGRKLDEDWAFCARCGRDVSGLVRPRNGGE